MKDPTGAGDSFAGGFIGYLAKHGSLEDPNLRQAIVAGSAAASFCCEDFSIDRFKNLGENELFERVQAFETMTMFDRLSL